MNSQTRIILIVLLIAAAAAAYFYLTGKLGDNSSGFGSVLDAIKKPFAGFSNMTSKTAAEVGTLAYNHSLQKEKMVGSGTQGLNADSMLQVAKNEVSTADVDFERINHKLRRLQVPVIPRINSATGPDIGRDRFAEMAGHKIPKAEPMKVVSAKKADHHRDLIIRQARNNARRS